MDKAIEKNTDKLLGINEVRELSFEEMNEVAGGCWWHDVKAAVATAWKNFENSQTTTSRTGHFQ
jgi:hypothetical protein